MLYDDDYGFFDHCFNAGGVLLDTAGAKMMLLVATILTGVGAATVVLLVGRIRPKNRKTAADCGLELA